MVTRDLAEGQVILGQETFLNTSMPIGMEGILRGVQTHVGDPLFEPQIKLMPEDGGEGTRAVRNLKDWGVSETLVLPVNIDETENRLDRTEEVVLRRRQRNLVDAFAELVVFGFLHGDNDSVVDVVAKRGDVFPA